MILRDYQKQIISDIKKQYLKGLRRVLIVLGCGGGKSAIIGSIIKSATEKKKQVLFLVHRKELINQIEQTLKGFSVNFNLCQLVMIQTASRNLNKIKPPNIIIIDESHHILASSYIKILDTFNDTTVLGFTATPIRRGEGGLGKVFESMVNGVSTKWLISNKYLAPYRYFSVQLASADKLNIRGGDYKKDQLALLMEKNRIYGDTVENWLRIAKGRKTIVYCSSVKSSLETCISFNENNIVAEHLDGTTNKKIREEAIIRFRKGKTMVLCNAELFGEGLDIPDCECVVLLRPTKSLSLFIQQSMRSMRIDPSNPRKIAIIIDHVKNIYEHGFPDEEREWDLKSKKVKKKNEVPIKQCDKCFMVYDSIHKKCKFCGYQMVVSESKYEVEKIEMELKELKRRDILKNLDYEYYKKLQTFSQLVEFQKEKKYKFAWVIRKAEELSIEIPKKYIYMKNKYIYRKF